jgi:DNA polymerase-3 subunit delta
VSGESLKPVYLIVGGDAPKVARALRRLRGRFDAGSVDDLVAGNAAGEVSGADVVGATHALGLFGGGERLVVCGAVERWKKADVDAVSTYLESPTPGAVLALTGDAGKLPAGLEAACAAAGDVLRYDVPTKKRGSRQAPDYAAWVRRQLESSRVRFDAGVPERVVELVGEDAFALQAEAEKLAAWAVDQPVSVRDVERLVVPSEDMPHWALADAWGSRDVAAALAASTALLEQLEPFAVAARLADHVSKVRAVQALLDQDVELNEIAARLGLKPFPARKQAGQARNFTPEELRRALVRLAALDYAVKGGSRLDPELELERAIVDVTAGGPPAPG